MADDGRVGQDDDGVGARARGGHRLTYRYRLGGGASDASGTIKAPSFADAARSLVRRRLARHLGAGPACLRLRAAGQEEVLYRVTPPGEGMGRRPHLAEVPPDSHRFAPPDDADRDAAAPLRGAGRRERGGT